MWFCICFGFGLWISAACCWLIVFVCFVASCVCCFTSMVSSWFRFGLFRLVILCWFAVFDLGVTFGFVVSYVALWLCVIASLCLV